MDFKLLKEIKQAGMMETIDFTLSKWTPNRNLKEHVQSEYPLTSWIAVLFHFQASLEHPNRSDTREAIKAVEKTM